MSLTLKMAAPKDERTERPTFVQRHVKPDLDSKMKLQYVSPSITFVLVGLESGLAAGSAARVQIGSPSDPNTPEVEDWTTGGSENQVYL